MSRFYITTPIYYVSDVPHIGHAYTTIVADALARYHRMRGDTTHFLTGTDEHGQKIARIAEERGKTSQRLRRQDSPSATATTWKALEISNDDFIRTTDRRSRGGRCRSCGARWRRAATSTSASTRAGTASPASSSTPTRSWCDGNSCPVHKRPVETVKEQSFYFRLSKYHGAAARARTTRHARVHPARRFARNEVRAFVEGGLRDLSISRTTFTWGVPVPDHPGHVVYVWIDALMQLLLGDAPQATPPTARTSGRRASQIVHVIGKEISRFHAVYWPAFLMAAGLARCRRTVFCHGWWTVDGEKMSKTLGNVVDPLKLADDIGVDAFRYFVLREVPLGARRRLLPRGSCFSRYNAELANDLGNLLNRTLGMVHKYFADSSPGVGGCADPFDVAARGDGVRAGTGRVRAVARRSRQLWELVRARQRLHRSEGAVEAGVDRAEILGNVLELCRVIVAPARAGDARARAARCARSSALDEPTAVAGVGGDARFRRPGGDAAVPAHRRRSQEGAARALAAASAGKPRGAPDAVTRRRPRRPPRSDGRISFDEFGKVDLRVAEIVAAEPVPKAKKLLKLDRRARRAEQRQVVAGIAEAYAPDALVGQAGHLRGQPEAGDHPRRRVARA